MINSLIADALQRQQNLENLYLYRVVNGGQWHRDEDGVIQVHGSVIIEKAEFEKIPMKFGVVSGAFELQLCNKLTSLVNCPYRVGGSFRLILCDKVTSLRGGPQKVSAVYEIRNCESLKSLAGAAPGKGIAQTTAGGFVRSPGYVIRDCVSLSDAERDTVLFDERGIRDLWLSTGLDFEEFMTRRKGQVKGHKFGI